MKKILSLLLVLTLLLCTACGGSTTEQPAPSDPAAEELTGLLKNAIAFDPEGGLYIVGEETGAEYCTVTPFGEDQLLVHTTLYDENSTYLTAGSDLKIVSLLDGSTVAETHIDYRDYVTVSVTGGTIMVQTPGNNQVLFLDDTLQITQELTLPSSDGGMVWLSEDEQTLYCYNYEGTLTRIDRRSGERTRLLSEYPYINYDCQGTGSVVFTHPQMDSVMDARVRLDLSDGSLHEISLDRPISLISIVGDTWQGVLPDVDNLQIIGGDDGVLRSYRQDPAFVTLTSQGHLLTCSQENHSLALHTTDGKCIAKAAVPITNENQSFSVVSDLLWSDTYGGYFFHGILYDPAISGEVSYLFFWDTSKTPEHEDLTMRDYTAMKPEAPGAAAPALYARAEEIGRQYGIRVLVADQCDTDFLDYTTDIVTDPFTVSVALDNLEKCLAKYPDGFFDQLQDENIHDLEIQLVGKLYAKEHHSLHTAIAFALPMNDQYLIAVDSYVNREQDFHHELGHAIDDKMFWDSVDGSNPLYSEETWRSFNPPGFEYRFDYSDYMDADYDFDYFIDAYSCTFSNEDRARVWEYAMIDRAYMFMSEPLRQKLDYFNRCIRESFDTTGWPEVLPAEQVLLDSYE